MEVRRAALSEAGDRLASLSSELVVLLEAEFEERLERQERAGRSREVRGALLTSRVDTADLTRVLDSLRTDSDGDLPVAVLGPNGGEIFSVGAMPPGVDPDPDPPLRSVRAFGSVRTMDGRNLYWETTPVRGSGDGVLGWIVQRRRLGTGDELTRLFGRGYRFRFGQIQDSVWVDLAGSRWWISPETVALGRAFTLQEPDGPPTLARARRIDRTPWVVLFDVPLSQVFARPRAFLTRMILLGGLVIAGSVLLVWWASRRLTRPLIELAEAADAVSAGDYRRRVDVEGEDEVGRLANAFNGMSEQVARSEAALSARLEEARRLAARLAEARRAADQARQEAEVANQAKADVLAAISHEIRTPISAVMAYAEMLQHLGPEHGLEKRRKYVRRIEECAEMLAALTNDVLDFSCIETGKLRIELEPGLVEEATRFAVGSLEPRATEKGVTVSNHCSNGATFLGDRQRVQQIVMNLVSNAVKFTPEGGRITVRCQTDVEGRLPGLGDARGPWVAIHVEDTGPGIDAEEIERIFEPFQRGTPMANGKGSSPRGVGLGLSISRQLAAMMSGTITVQSRVGRGSRFTLWLPSSARSAPRPRPRHTPRPDPSPAASPSPDSM